MNDFLEVKRHGRILRVVLNRPEKRNALSADLCRALTLAIEEGERDTRTGAILLTANGSSFCAGMDLGEIGTAASDELNAVHERLFTLGARLKKPLIAAVQGPALGGGTGLVANCHIVLVSETATFGLTEIRLGLWPFLVFRAVAAAVGERRTTELSLSGRIFGPREALELGLVHLVSPDLEKAAVEMAETVASWSPTSIRAGMAFVEEARGADWKTAGEIARRVRSEVFASADFHEGIRAFREKRPPRWPSLEE